MVEYPIEVRAEHGSVSRSARGVLYVACGRAYVSMALNSIRTLRRTNAGMPAAVVTNVRDRAPDLPWWRKGEDHWIFADIDTSENRKLKTALTRYTPFDKTLYLDCDTEVLRDLSEFDRFLDYFDLCLRLREGGHPGTYRLFGGTVPIGELPFWNGGVIAFRRCARTEAFFEHWSRIYASLGAAIDQPSLIEAIFLSDCRLLSLDGRWNAGEGTVLRDRRGAVRILHYTSDHSRRLRRDLLGIDAELERQGFPEKGMSLRDHLAKARASRIRRETLRRYAIERQKRFLLTVLHKWRGRRGAPASPR